MVLMSYDSCMLKGPRGRCAIWPILDPASQIHPGILLGGGGNGVCVSHGLQLLADIRRGDSDAYDEAGVPTDLEGQPRDGSVRNEDYRRQIERVHEVWKAASSYTYLGMRSRRVATPAQPSGARKNKKA